MYCDTLGNYAVPRLSKRMILFVRAYYMYRPSREGNLQLKKIV